MSNTKLIDSIELPKGLRSLNAAQIKVVAKELRDELIDSVASSGGHFASSLGANELSVVLHYLFNTPEDKIVWDVGHQAYVHKMLTGRRDRLKSIRQKDGISGFLKRDESEYDVFGAGHAGTSISAAVGISVAQNASNKTEKHYSIAVIGDGSLTSGMAFEALNHAGALKLNNFIVVLNDNEMSISANVGALSRLFSKTVTSTLYTQARAGFKHLHQSGIVPDLLYKFVDRAEEAAQSFMSHTSLLFEAFGFRYLGPIDGHDIDELISAFNHAKAQEGPVLVHIRTSKGKGYEPAEEDPIKWHGVTPFDREKAQFLASAPAKKIPSYTQVFAQSLIEVADKNPNLVAITAAMPTGTGLDIFEKKHPDKFFDVGICEQHAVTFAAGLSCEGKLPVCAIYSTFLQRAFDQVVHDVCIQNLPVIFAMDRGGVVGNDGETHQGVFDISYLRTLPNMILMSPKDESELRDMVHTACTTIKSPVGIRYPRGNGIGADLSQPAKIIDIGKAELIQTGSDLLLVAYGPMVQTAISVANKLKSLYGTSCTIINARFAKPLDQETFRQQIANHNLVAVIEDHALMGGFSSAILELINDYRIELKSPMLRFGVLDKFVTHGSQNEQYQLNGYDADSIVSQLEQYPVLRTASVA